MVNKSKKQSYRHCCVGGNDVIKKLTNGVFCESEMVLTLIPLLPRLRCCKKLGAFERGLV